MKSATSTSLEKAKSAFIAGNYALCKDHLTHLKKQISSSPFPFNLFDDMLHLLSSFSTNNSKEQKEKEQKELYEQGLKILKKIRKTMEKECLIKNMEDLKYDQITSRDKLNNLFFSKNYKDKNKLLEQNIFTDDFKIYFASQGNINHAEEYRNNLKFYSHEYLNLKTKNKNFMAIAKDKLGNFNGVISTETSDFNIVKHIDDTHLIYKEEKKYHCAVTPEFTEKHSTNILLKTCGGMNAKPRDSAAQNKIIKVWMETAYDVLEYFKKAVAENPKESMINYVMTLFNIVKTIYMNEKVEILLQGIYVWDLMDPFGARDSADVLDKYQKYRNNPQNKWEGNLAHLLSFEHGKGSAIAFVDVLCAREYAYGFTWMQKHSSDIQNPSSKNPGSAPITSYSWNSSTIAHEMGHGFSCLHTFSCTWLRNGLRNQSLGGAPYTEGSCPNPGNIPEGRTIMGYESDYPMTNGFGQQPGDVIRKRVAEATCI